MLRQLTNSKESIGRKVLGCIWQMHTVMFSPFLLDAGIVDLLTVYTRVQSARSLHLRELHLTLGIRVLQGMDMFSPPNRYDTTSGILIA